VLKTIVAPAVESAAPPQLNTPPPSTLAWFWETVVPDCSDRLDVPSPGSLKIPAPYLALFGLGAGVIPPIVEFATVTVECAPPPHPTPFEA
jgi:hypothetical protein